MFIPFICIVAMALFSFSDCERVRSGDIVFVVEQASSDSVGNMDRAILDATGTTEFCATHVGIIEVHRDSLWVIDATPEHGVSRRLMSDFSDEFLKFEGTRLVIMRLNEDFDSGQVIERAKSFIGRKYDYAFLPGNDCLYCSELVQSCFIDESGNPFFESKPMNFKDKEGNFPEYWTQLFASLGMPVPQDVPGTNPQDMMLSNHLSTIANTKCER